MKPGTRPHQQVLRSQRVMTANGLRPADVVLREGSIGRIADHRTAGEAEGAVQDFGEAVIMPGLADVHCHINEPGRTEWEGFGSATRAAAAGGVTLLVDMPLNSDPVTTSATALDQKAEAAKASALVDVAFYGGLIPSNASDHQSLVELSRSGAAAFKCFLCDSGLEDFPAVVREQLRVAMPQIAQLGKRLLAHAELIESDASENSPTKNYDDYLRARPQVAEQRAIEMLAELCQSSGCAVHIVHLSASGALPILRDLRATGVPITVETCPHYLTFCAEEIDATKERGERRESRESRQQPNAGLDPRFKCAPPIRSADNREELWQGLADGTIDFVASDHSPCPPDLKFTGSWDSAWGGIASLQLLLPAVWTQARQRSHDIERIVDWLSTRPTQWLGCSDRGELLPGNRADLVIWHPERSFTVHGKDLQHRHPLTPYEGRQLFGTVERTMVRGTTVYETGAFSRNDGSRDHGWQHCGIPLRLRAGFDHHYPGFEAFLALSPDERRSHLAGCCGARSWIDAVQSTADETPPWRSAAAVFRASEKVFDTFDESDWREAFLAHPRIGDLGSLRDRFASTKTMASAEQSGALGASEQTLAALARGNQEYEERFGHVFLICASGRTAEQMLASLQQRLSNSSAKELRIASEEQRKITFLRLEKLLAT